MSISVVPIESKSEIKKFLKMQWKIYENNPNWVPPLLFDKMKLLDTKKNPFFKHAQIQMFLAYKDDEIVGRIAAIKNDLHNKEHDDKVGFFGFFESIDDQLVANSLLDAAKYWLLEKGFDVMRGPANPSVNDEYALLVEGFDDPPRMLMPYNPPYYIKLLENYGLYKAKDLYAYKIINEEIKKSEKIFRISDIALRRSNVSIRGMDMKNFNAELERVKYVYNKAWAPNWGFVPLTDEEIDYLAADLKPLVDPNLVLFMENEKETVGFALVLPDYNYIFKEMNGRLLPFNFIKLFTQRKNIPWARIIILGLIPEYQKKGLDASFYVEVVKRAAERGIFLGEASWILEDNNMMVRGAETMKGVRYKTYRIYQMTIA